jgi:hypothetical protein
MATPAQITANRVNAQVSTGPRSVEGKAASSRNSLKLGLHAKSMIIPGEDPGELEELSAAYLRKFQPVGPIETDLVQDIIRLAWMKRRYYTLESEVLSSRIAALPEDSPHPLGAAMIHDSSDGDSLGKIFRRLQATQRDWHTAINELTNVQAIRRRAESEEGHPNAGAAVPAPTPNRVRFSDPPPPPAVTRAPEPLENLALRL